MALQPDGSVVWIPDPRPPKPQPVSLSDVLQDIADWVEETVIPAIMKGAAQALEHTSHAAGTALSSVVVALEPALGRGVFMAAGATSVGGYVWEATHNPLWTGVAGAAGAVAGALAGDWLFPDAGMAQ